MRTNRLTVMLIVLSIITAMVAGCAPTFSKQALDQVDRSILFGELQRNPGLFLGKFVLFSGVIIETRNTQEGSFIEVLQRPTDRQGRPRETDDTEGRFIITSTQFLDPAEYQPGKRISVVGEVIGQKLQPLGEMQYRYPLISAKEVRIWEPRTSPRVSFGIGVGVFHRF